jgi:hypothetical protein
MYNKCQHHIKTESCNDGHVLNAPIWNNLLGNVKAVQANNFEIVIRIQSFCQRHLHNR